MNLSTRADITETHSARGVICVVRGHLGASTFVGHIKDLGGYTGWFHIKITYLYWG